MKSLLAAVLGNIISKTFTKQGIHENLSQQSTMAAAGAALAAGAMEVPTQFLETPKSEAELITQLILAAVALFLYYRDDRGGK